MTKIFFTIIIVKDLFWELFEAEYTYLFCELFCLHYKLSILIAKSLHPSLKQIWVFSGIPQTLKIMGVLALLPPLLCPKALMYWCNPYFH